MTQTEQLTSVQNSIQLRGRVGKNPTRKSEHAPATFDLAVWQGKDREPMWLTIKCWDELAQRVLTNGNVYKGVLVEVHGRLTSEVYEKRRIFAVVASSVEVIRL